ncbi:hypothetical protein OAQ28_09300 [Planktomarina temperata]|nr:hypothetical protein [Planktomarina temperata]
MLAWRRIRLARNGIHHHLHQIATQLLQRGCDHHRDIAINQSFTAFGR